MKEAEYIRVGRRVYLPNGTLYKQHDSINQAKKWSRTFQHPNHGDGRVRVQEKKP